MSPTKKTVLLLAIAALLSGCSATGIVSRVSPYRIDVRQGNYLDQNMISQLRKGMTQEQVQFVLGRSLLVDAFRSDRWDYVYYFKPGNGNEPERRIFSVFFDAQGLLDYVDGDVVAADGQNIETANPVKNAQVVNIEGSRPKKKKK